MAVLPIVVMAGLMVHTWHPSSEAGGPRVAGQPGLAT